MPTMLIVDDNQQIVSILQEYARHDGFDVHRASDGDEALRVAKARVFDIILLDVMMPGKDGFDVCREIRRTSDVPIIMVTAKGEDYDKIMGLDIGADDYIVKPFSPGEVMARVRAVLRRIPLDDHLGEQILRVGGLAINLDEHTVTVGDTTVSLTRREAELLWTLATNKNRVLSREMLLDGLWGYDYDGDARTVDSHIKRLRAKLEVVATPDWAITTVWSVGYKFEDRS